MNYNVLSNHIRLPRLRKRELVIGLYQTDRQRRVRERKRELVS